MPKYIEIHPLCYNSAQHFSDSLSCTEGKPASDYYTPCEPHVIRTDLIQQIVPSNPDKTISLYRIRINDNYQDDILVSKEEGDNIKKMLLHEEPDELAKEIGFLTNNIRLLYDLLRARMR